MRSGTETALGFQRENRRHIGEAVFGTVYRWNQIQQEGRLTAGAAAHCEHPERRLG